MGATLQISGAFVSFFAIPITLEDQEALQTQSGDCRGQQVWEALAGLVALRTWSPYWQHFPVVLQVRNDNVGALTLFSTLKGGSTALSVIAREFALDLGKATCRPALIQHLPGITNKTCDALSRRFDPHYTFELPRCLLHAKPIVPPTRDSRRNLVEKFTGHRAELFIGTAIGRLKGNQISFPKTLVTLCCIKRYKELTGLMLHCFSVSTDLTLHCILFHSLFASCDVVI